MRRTQKQKNLRAIIYIGLTCLSTTILILFLKFGVTDTTGMSARKAIQYSELDGGISLALILIILMLLYCSIKAVKLAKK